MPELVRLCDYNPCVLSPMEQARHGVACCMCRRETSFPGSQGPSVAPHNLMAALVLMCSLAALLQFFVSYCRSLVLAYEKVELSPEFWQLAGPQSHTLGGGQFHRLLELVKLHPAPADDSTEIRAIRGYFLMLGGLRAALEMLAPEWADRVERERHRCAYLAAVALDRRIALATDGTT